MKDQLVETWNIHDRINRYLLDAVPDEALSSSMAARHRTVGALFAHLHNVRLMWLKSALPDALDGVAKIEKGAPLTKKLLHDTLKSSGKAIEHLLEHAFVNSGRVKGFKPHVTAFVGYMIAHDAHHRSQIIIAFKQSGHQLDKKVLYGIWEWGTR